MTTSETIPTQQQVSNSNIFRGIKFAALIPVLSGAAYLTGVRYYQEHLRIFELPAGIIEKSTSEYFIFAHTAVVYLLLKLLKYIFGNFEWMFLVCIAILTWRLMKAIEEHSKNHPKILQIKAFFVTARRMRIIGEAVLVPTAVSIGFGYVVLVLTTVLIIPNAVGTTAGRLVAEEEKKLYQRGCPTSRETKYFCNEISAGKILMQGFILETSEKYLSFYDPSINKARTIPASNFEFHAMH